MSDPTAVKSHSRTRRALLANGLALGAAAGLLQAQPFLEGMGWLSSAQATTLDVTADTFNGLFAFVLPGSDAYSIAQGVSNPDPGGVDAGSVDVLLATLDETTPFVPAFSVQVAAILNNLALIVNPAPGGAFPSPFARLSFPEKAFVFQIMDATEPLKLLGGILPAFVAFFCYSEAAVYDPATRSIDGVPIGWELCAYQGVSDGRDEFLGYFNPGRDLR